jgi:hypothetical protein
VERGLRARTEAARAGRERIANSLPGMFNAASIIGYSVTEAVGVPLNLIVYSDHSEPCPINDLKRELFDGPWPTGTMVDHYSEMFGGKFRVEGNVLGWVKLPQSDFYYAGPQGCKGTCSSARLNGFLATALKEADKNLDLTLFDNQGADGRPNSGDDDGYVDFVTFVHPPFGGECTNIPTNGGRTVGSLVTGRVQTRSRPTMQAY